MAKLKDGNLEIERNEDEPAGKRSMKEKLDLLLEYQKVPAETEGEWLRQKGLHSEHLPLFRQEISSVMTDRADEKDLYAAVEHYAYVYYNNMRPHSANNHRTPFEKRYGKIRSCCYNIA